MLVSLHIENYALIEKLSIKFDEGFTTITGETGAGKSILLGALGLVLGKRADLFSLKNKEEKCIVEAYFNIEKYNLEPFFIENDLDFEKTTIIRREILPSGKSRAFINDTPTNLNELQALGEQLLDIHSQHQTLEIEQSDFQFQVIDALANNSVLLAKYQLQLKKYKQLVSSKIDLETSLAESLKEQDYNLFLLNELLQAQLKPNEQEILEKQVDSLSNIENIKENFSKAISFSNADQFGVVQNLKEIKFAIQKTKTFSTKYHELFQRIDSVLIEFLDIVQELESTSDQLISDPETLFQANEKLQLIYNLQKKHQVNSIMQLLEIQTDLDKKVISVSNLENEINKTDEELKLSKIELQKLATTISENRNKAIPVLTSKMKEIVANLGMKNAEFTVNLNQQETFLANGFDEIQFLFSANKGTTLESLKKVASGGEKSRIMLAIKSILSEYSNMPTLIFDEIDTGVSGEIADKMGIIMQKMATKMQIFAITHLPQIASKGKNHFKVFKQDINHTTVSEIKLLNQNERIQEIAQMISGSLITEAALNQAKELIHR